MRLRLSGRHRGAVLGVVVAAGLGIVAFGLIRPSTSSPQPVSAVSIGTSPTTLGGQGRPAPIPMSALSTGSVVPKGARRPSAILQGDLLAGRRPDLLLGRGHVVLVNFWASWCDPCRREAPELARYAVGAGAGRLVGVAVNDGHSAALDFVARFGWRFTNVFDPDGRLLSAYRILGLPTTVVVDGDGRVASVLLGPQTAASLEQAASSVARSGS